MESRDQAANRTIEAAWKLAQKSVTPGVKLTKEDKEQLVNAKWILQLEASREKAITERTVAKMECFIKALNSGYSPESLRDFFTDPFAMLEQLVNEQKELRRELLPPYRQHQLVNRLNQEQQETYEDLRKG